MRRSPQQIKALLARQAASDESIASFCDRHGLNAGTFYSWRVKYASPEPSEAAGGFTRVVAAPRVSAPTTTLQLPGGARLQLTDWTTADIARLARQLLATDA